MEVFPNYVVHLATSLRIQFLLEAVKQQGANNALKLRQNIDLLLEFLFYFIF